MIDLESVLEKHRAWLRGEMEGERADLSGADLSGAILRDADLRDASLWFANLRDADLIHADLSYADLSGADLSGADLSGVDLCGVRGNMTHVKSLQCEGWAVAYTATHMQIGCQRHTITQWWEFSDNEIESMAGGALDPWRIWKPILQQIIAASPAEPAN